MSFHATCTHPDYMPHGNTEKQRLIAFAHWEAHGFCDGTENRELRTLTFTDPAEYEAHVKAAGFGPYEYSQNGNTYRLSSRQPVKSWKPPTRKPFDPQLGEVGSWVYTFVHDSGGNSYYVSGQVWSVIRGGSRPRVWVADGESWYDVAVSQLEIDHDAVAEQLELVSA